MFAVIREIAVKPGNEVCAEQREEAEAIQAGMPGFCGQLTVDIGNGKFIRIGVWASEEERDAHANSTDEQRLIDLYWSHMDMPLIGLGSVVSNTLLKEYGDANHAPGDLGARLEQ